MPSGHTQQDSAQARRTGPRPLAPIPFEVEAAFPELTGTVREVTLLYPRAGQPGPDDSSIGGPLLWPADEPWPMCAEPDHYKPLSAPVGPEPVAMVPVVQLYARNVPNLVFPADTDLLQILWCPLVHEDDQYAANPRLYWRSSALIAAGATAGEPPRPHTAEGDYLPRPCTVSPTPAVEYPNWDLPEGLGELLDERFEALKDERGYDYFEVATTQQSKVGGYPGWTQPPDWPDCAGCGTRMEHLLSVTATEPGMGRWLPLDDRDPRPDRGATPARRGAADTRPPRAGGPRQEHSD
ncbi:hypothetical protein, partial [Streptomyces sp. NPDC058451]|uniref:hypothetical protein n=1 Tax=Streptomyces sp. NPDC058451 TaxID=3346506 RepID=UPI0036479731